MKLKSLGLTNFRGFDRLDIRFDDRLTVFAGVNGAGKSTILQAIAIAFSHALPEFTVSREKPVAIVVSDIQQGKSSCVIEMENTAISESRLITSLAKESLDSNEKLALIHKQQVLIKELSKVEKAIPSYKDIKNEISWIDRRLDGTFEKRFNWLFVDVHESEARLKRHLKSSPNQPLAIYYSTSRFLSKLPPALKGGLPFKQASAFNKSLTQLEVSLNDFAKWHRAMNSARVIRRNGRYADGIFNFLQDAIAGLMPQIREFWFHEENPPRYSVMKDATIKEQVNNGKAGKKLFLEQLSDGERGLLALVFDLTRRLAIANPACDNPIAEGVALVLIDEIEMHLHPKWQRDVLRRLQDTFKSCQFVVTTHSPMVLGEVPAGSVRFLEYLDGKMSVTVPTEAYGMDANRILHEFMDAPVRNQKVDGELKSLFELIDREHFGEARTIIARLGEKLGEDEPELIRASSLIRFLEGAE